MTPAERHTLAAGHILASLRGQLHLVELLAEHLAPISASGAASIAELVETQTRQLEDAIREFEVTVATTPLSDEVVATLKAFGVLDHATLMAATAPATGTMN